MNDEHAKPQRADRVAPALLAIRGAGVVAVAAVVYAFVVHYAGAAPVSGFEPWYPKLSGYGERRTPDMAGAHGLDFSQVYLAARATAAGDEVYYRVDLEHWRRKWSSTYHPVAHWLYVPLAQLRFRTALVVHNAIGIAVLLGVGAGLLAATGLLRAWPSVAWTTLLLLFFTPTGLLHMERGQFDLFTAASYVCTFALFAVGGGGWAVAGGLVSSLKVTSWGFVAPFWIVAAPLRGLRRWDVWLLPVTIALLLLVLIAQVLDWLPAIRYVAENTSLRGPSFHRILPPWLARVVPLASTVAIGAAAFVALRRRGELEDDDARRRLLDRVGFPLAAVLALQAAGATPVTHDYRLVALLGGLPLMIVWCERTADELGAALRWATCLGYAFVLVAGMRVRPFFGMGYDEMATLLLTASLAFLGVTLWLAWRDPGPGRFV